MVGIAHLPIFLRAWPIKVRLFTAHIKWSLRGLIDFDRKIPDWNKLLKFIL